MSVYIDGNPMKPEVIFPTSCELSGGSCGGGLIDAGYAVISSDFAGDGGDWSITKKRAFGSTAIDVGPIASCLAHVIPAMYAHAAAAMDAVFTA